MFFCAGKQMVLVSQNNKNRKGGILAKVYLRMAKFKG